MVTHAKNHEILDVLIVYLIVFTGVLSLLVLLLLLSVAGFTGLGSDAVKNIMSVILLPLTFDMILVAPGVSTSLLTLLIILPLVLITIVVLRIVYIEFLSRVLPYLYKRMEELKHRFDFEVTHGRKYGQATLTAVSLGATIGPSTFILAPYTVLKYGFAGILGFILASVVSWLLAWRYSIMYYSIKKDRTREVVGGPAFVKYGYGEKDPRYLLSRFMMWIGNSALVAFNMLIVIDLLSFYMFKPLFGYDLPVFYKVIFLILLSFAILILYKTWENAISIQSYITLLFIILFIAHILFIGREFNITQPSLHFSLNGDLIDFIVYILSESAYIYIVAFGFQEVIGLGENVKGSTESERFRVLRNSIIGGAVIANFITLFYLVELYILQCNGVSIPSTPIPALDMLKNVPIVYWLTLLTIFLGVLTTLVPAFVASLKHLEQLGIDFFGIKTSGALPYVVIIIAWYLFTTGAEFLIHLTDFTVLVSLTFIALSENPLLSNLSGKKIIKKNIGKIIALITILMVITLASQSRSIAEQSIIFMWLSTIVIMSLSYNLTTVEFFSVFVSILAIVFVSPLMVLLTDLANLGILKPEDLPMYTVSFIGLWSLYISVVAVIIHLLIKYKDLLAEVFGSVMIWFTSLLKNIIEL